MQHSPEHIRLFFARSDALDYLVLRPLSHIASNWELIWDADEQRYESEPNSFADDLNWLIGEIANRPRPARYHDHEDAIVRMLEEASWPVQDPKGRWITADYPHLLERAAMSDLDQQNLITAATGRVHAALDHHDRFDDMEKGHRRILSGVMSIVLYYREMYSDALLYDEPADAG